MVVVIIIGIANSDSNQDSKTHPVVVFAAALFILWIVSGQIGGCIERRERDKQFRIEWHNQIEADRKFQELPHWAK